MCLFCDDDPDAFFILFCPLNDLAISDSGHVTMTHGYNLENEDRFVLLLYI